MTGIAVRHISQYLGQSVAEMQVQKVPLGNKAVALHSTYYTVHCKQAASDSLAACDCTRQTNVIDRNSEHKHLYLTVLHHHTTRNQWGNATPAGLAWPLKTTKFHESIWWPRNTTTRCLKKVPIFKLSVTLWNLNVFSNFLHYWKAYEICYKTHTTLPTSP